MRPLTLDERLAKNAELMKKKKEKLEARKKARTEKEAAKRKEESKKKAAKRRRELYKPIHKKNLKKKQNARYYRKKKQAIAALRKATGDVRGYYRVVLMHNRGQVDELKASWWLHTAMARFEEYVKKHNDGVICEKQVKRDADRNEHEYHDEILLLKKVDTSVDDGVRSFRNKDGLFVDHIVANNKNYAIIAKSDVYTPEVFNVYGYSPMNDKKTGRWIFDNLISNDCSRENFKNVFILDNKLVIQHGTDFDLVICRNPDECSRLYEGLRLETGTKNKYVQYSGNVVKSMKPRFYDMIQEKTGWIRRAVTVSKT